MWGFKLFHLYFQCQAVLGQCSVSVCGRSKLAWCLKETPSPWLAHLAQVPCSALEVMCSPPHWRRGCFPSWSVFSAGSLQWPPSPPAWCCCPWAVGLHTLSLGPIREHRGTWCCIGEHREHRGLDSPFSNRDSFLKEQSVLIRGIYCKQNDPQGAASLKTSPGQAVAPSVSFSGNCPHPPALSFPSCVDLIATQVFLICYGLVTEYRMKSNLSQFVVFFTFVYNLFKEFRILKLYAIESMICDLLPDLWFLLPLYYFTGTQ